MVRRQHAQLIWRVDLVSVDKPVARSAVVVRAKDWRHFVMIDPCDFNWETIAAAIMKVFDAEFRTSRPAGIEVPCHELAQCLVERESLRFVDVRYVESGQTKRFATILRKHLDRAA